MTTTLERDAATEEVAQAMEQIRRVDEALVGLVGLIAMSEAARNEADLTRLTVHLAKATTDMAERALLSQVVAMKRAMIGRIEEHLTVLAAAYPHLDIFEAYRQVTEEETVDVEAGA